MFLWMLPRAKPVTILLEKCHSKATIVKHLRQWLDRMFGLTGNCICWQDKTSRWSDFNPTATPLALARQIRCWLNGTPGGRRWIYLVSWTNLVHGCPEKFSSEVNIEIIFVLNSAARFGCKFYALVCSIKWKVPWLTWLHSQDFQV